MAKLHAAKHNKFCGCSYCRNNPIGLPQTEINRTEVIPVEALPDYERLLNLGQVTDYNDYLERYVKGPAGEDGTNGDTYIPNPDTGTYWLNGEDTGIPIGENYSPESDTDLFF